MPKKSSGVLHLHVLRKLLTFWDVIWEMKVIFVVLDGTHGGNTTTRHGELVLPGSPAKLQVERKIPKEIVLVLVQFFAFEDNWLLVSTPN